MTTVYIIAKDNRKNDGIISGEIEWREGEHINDSKQKSFEILSPLYSMCIKEGRKTQNDNDNDETNLHPRLFVETNKGIQQLTVDNNGHITLERTISTPEIDATKEKISTGRAETWRSSMTVFMEGEHSYIGILGYKRPKIDVQEQVGVFRAEIIYEKDTSGKSTKLGVGKDLSPPSAEKLLAYVEGVNPLGPLVGNKSLIFYVETEKSRGRVLAYTQNGIQVARNKRQELYLQPRVLCLFGDKIYMVSEVDATDDRHPKQYLIEFSETLEEKVKKNIRTGDNITAFAVAYGNYKPESVGITIPLQYNTGDAKIRYGFVGNEAGTISIVDLETKDILAEFDILSPEAKEDLNKNNNQTSDTLHPYRIDKLIAKERADGNIDLFVQYRTMIVHVQSYQLLTQYAVTGENTGKVLDMPRLTSKIKANPDVYLSATTIRAFEVLVK